MDNVNEINSCEVCDGKKLESVLNLGELPLCDDLLPIGSKEDCIEYSTEILFCVNCSTAHQRFQVDKSYLFPETYHYRARFTKDVLIGMQDIVDQCVKNYGDLKNKKILDIGCNDGSLLTFFSKKGAKTYGIEPTGAALEAQEQGHIVVNDFFNLKTSEKFVKDYGKPDFITFTNVFAHIENLNELLYSLKKLLSDNTIIIVENHYLGSILNSNQFDTFYHEHPRSYSYASFLEISKKLDCTISNVEFPARYGGNIRVYMENGSLGKQVDAVYSREILSREKDFQRMFQAMSENIFSWKKSKQKEISKLLVDNQYVVAKAFPGRAAILIRILELDHHTIHAVYEKDGSKKIGKYVPGTKIPILPDSELFNSNDNFSIINLAWHIPNEIREYLKNNHITSKVIDIISPSDFKR